MLAGVLDDFVGSDHNVLRHRVLTNLDKVRHGLREAVFPRCLLIESFVIGKLASLVFAMIFR